MLLVAENLYRIFTIYFCQFFFFRAKYSLDLTPQQTSETTQGVTIQFKAQHETQ